MLLTISTTHAPATDLGYLLHKHPDRCQSFDLAFGKAHVFYPTAGEDCCTAALLLDVDPVGMVRNRRGPAGEGFYLRQYVNDRPFVASSLMSVAIARVYGSALSGRCEQRSELVEQAIPLTAKLSVVPCRGGEVLLRRLFEPLGYCVTATRHPLDEKFPEWGDSSYYTVELSAECRLQDLLAHLYVLIPVLDDDKHYWVSHDEVDKLLSKGEGWLESHPEKELIARRYLKHQTGLMKAALERLVEEESPDADEVEEAHAAEEEAVEAPLRLNDQRPEAVVAALRDAGAKSVVDLGCGEGKLLKLLLKDKCFERIIGMDVSYRTLEIAQRRLNFDRLPPKQRERIEVIHGSLMYRDDRLAGFDAATVVEVIEHLDAPRLAAFERVVFECAKPRTVIVTTPNVEYNVRFETLPAGKFRHKDHRFEWTRAEFQAWANAVAQRFGYAVRFAPVGPVDSEVGSPTQMGVFSAASRHKIKPIRDSFSAEASYADAVAVSAGTSLTLCAHEFLDYARLRAEIARHIESEFRLEEEAGRKSALVGFLGGSIGPTTDAKFLLDSLWPGRVKYAFGLAHKKDKIDYVASDLFDVLDELFGNGVQHFVIADELVSGTQLTTDLNEIGRWADERKPVGVTFSVLSFEELSRSAAFPSLNTICESASTGRGDSLPIAHTRAFVAAHLLEKDSAGLAFRAVRWSGKTGEYDFVRRFQEVRPLRIRCCNGGFDFAIPSASSVDQVFGNMIRSITQQEKRIAGSMLVEAIGKAKCKHCKNLLARAVEGWQSGSRATN